MNRVDFSDEIKKINCALLKSLKKGRKKSAYVASKVEINAPFRALLTAKFGIKGRFNRIHDFFDTEIHFEHIKYENEFGFFIQVVNKSIEIRVGKSRSFKYFDKDKKEKRMNFEQNYISLRFCRELVL